MPSPAASTSSVRNVLRRFRRNRRGSAAVEFALVAPVFFALLFAIIETAIVFFAEPGARDHHPEFRAHDPDRSGADRRLQRRSHFKTYVCNQIPALFTCANVYVDVQSYPAFSSVSINSQIDASNNFVSNNLQYSPGGPGDIVVVRLFYQWPLFVTGLGYNISNLAGSKRLLVATAAFQNEPF